MNTRVEIGRFLLTALAVAISSVVSITILSSLSGGTVSGPFELILAVIAFVIALIAGVFVGLPTLWLAKVLGWDNQLWKLSGLGMVAGLIAGAAFTLPAYGSIGAFHYPKEILPFWTGLGAFSGFVAAQVWFWLHRSDRVAGDE